MDKNEGDEDKDIEEAANDDEEEDADEGNPNLGSRCLPKSQSMQGKGKAKAPTKVVNNDDDNIYESAPATKDDNIDDNVSAGGKHSGSNVKCPAAKATAKVTGNCGAMSGGKGKNRCVT